MKYFVKIRSVYLYEGRSHDKAVDALQLAINILRECRGTAVIAYKNADSMGQRVIMEGEETDRMIEPESEAYDEQVRRERHERMQKASAE